jgi:hypothetical protein
MLCKDQFIAPLSIERAKRCHERGFSNKAGINPEHLAQDVLLRYLDDEAGFLAPVERGIAAAERGEFIDEEEMDARIELMFQP